MAKQSITYTIDGASLAALGVHIAASSGVLDLPSLKQPQTYNWADSHGHIVDLDKPRYNARSIILDAWMLAIGKLDFAGKIKAFYDLITAPGLHQLLVCITPAQPLAFMVYMKDGMDVSKKWRDQQMYGTFKIKLEEPEPVKRVICCTATQAAITFRSPEMFNIYWGDGTVNYDVSADAETTVTHAYASAGTHCICFCGDVASLASFSTNGTVTCQ